MSAFAGPSTVTSGLVFDYDMSNTQKSWKGQPATNLLLNSQDFSTNWSGNLFNNWINSTVSTNVSTAPDGTMTADRLTGYYSRWTDSIAASVSTTYTFSCYLKNYNLSNPPYLHIAFGLNGGLVSYNNVTSVPIASISDWGRYSITVTSPSSGINQIQCGIDFGASKANSSGPYAVDVWGAQLETGSLVTPYIPTTSSSASRSTTQSIVDLTGQNTLTASSLTYDNNGEFSFNGSGNYIDVTGAGFTSGMSSYTLSHWSRRDVESRMPVAGRTSTAFYQYGDNSWYYTHGGVAAEYYYPHAASIPVGTWGHYCIVYNGSNVAIYRNAYLEGTQATTGTADWSQGLRIGYWSAGGGYAYSGKIGSVKFHNRALTAAEVSQEFNALRGRYGL